MSSEALSRPANSGKALHMNEDKPPETREERLAAKLRENLHRRKLQARSRPDIGPVGDAPALPKRPPKS